MRVRHPFGQLSSASTLSSFQALYTQILMDTIVYLGSKTRLVTFLLILRRNMELFQRHR